ncbi:MAG: type I-C CRISPR-associated endonuclease Cas1 [Blastocatellia bacterium]|nr:type I-C CRISPR-associated endonuclease Cas1 [Blastocatellia bacterium]
MQQILNTLYVMTPNSYLHLEGETLRLDVEKEKKLQVPIHHLGSVVCFGDVMVSPAAMSKCAETGKSIVFLDRNGRFKARLEGAVSGNILLRLAQYRSADKENVALDISRSIVAGKIKNSRQVLMRAARETSQPDDEILLDKNVAWLLRAVTELKSCTNIEQVRGIEGEAAKNYFSCIDLLVRPDIRHHFRMNGRTKHPPMDRFNALLSFIYTLLTNDCRSGLESVGLDPQLGFLHVARPGRASLALDLVEEFRAFIADRLALSLVNRGQLKEDDFVERPGGSVYLKDESRKTVIVAYQNRKQEEITHPLLDRKVPIGLLPHLQARLLAKAIRGDIEGYVPFLNK